MPPRPLISRRIAPLSRQLPDLAALRDYLHLQKLSPDRRAARLERAADVWDLRRIARRRTPKGPFDYVDGAAEREVSLRRARQAYEDLALRPRALRDVSGTSTSTTLAGGPASMPVAIAPTEFTRMMHSEGETAGVRAAHAAGIPFTLSTMGTATIEEVAGAGTGGRRWFQLYMPRDNRPLAEELIARAATAEFDLLMVTVDTAVAGARHRDTRNGMTFPPQLTPKTFLDASFRPEWWINFLTTKPLGFTNFGNGSESIQAIGQLFDPTLSFADIQWLRDQWPGRLLVKGVQTAEDASWTGLRCRC